MSRAPRTVALVASLAATACLVTENPGFQLNSGSGSASTTSTASATTGTTGTATDTAPTGTGGSASGSSGEASTDPLLTTTQDLTTTGTTTVVPDTATTTDATTTGDTTGAPQPMTAELKHYADIAQCDFPFWCVSGKDINMPGTAENWAAECFDAPFAPPFIVTRVGFAVFGSKDDPDASLEFHAYDMDAQAPVMEPFHVRALGVIASAGYRDFTLDPPVVVDAQRFCISVHSGSEFGSQLGLGLDDVLAPPGQTFVGINGPSGCDVGKFTDLSTIDASSETQWCIDATISTAP